MYYDKISDQLRIVHTDFGGKEDPNTVTIKNEDITLNVAGNTHSRFYYGDGGLLSNLVSDLQSVTAVEANSDQMIILSNATALWANVGNVLVEGNVTAGEFHGNGGSVSRRNCGRVGPQNNAHNAAVCTLYRGSSKSNCKCAR